MFRLRARGERRPSFPSMNTVGWLFAIRRFLAAVRQHRLTLISAAVAFYGFLSLFPGLAAVVSMYGLLLDGRSIERQLQMLGLVPASGPRLVLTELQRLASRPRQDLTVGLVTGLAAGLWSAQRGMGALCKALNIVYGVQERRSFLRRSALSLTLTVGGILLVASTLILMTGLSDWLQWRWRLLGSLLGWPAAAASMLLALAVVYRWGPHRPHATWHWLSPGSVLATAAWLLGSWVFSFYISHFAGFNRTYGSMAAIAILMTWVYLSALVVLLGAQVDACRARDPGGMPASVPL